MLNFFQKGDEVTHHKGDQYVVLGVANQKTDRKGFVKTVIYHRKGTDPLNDANWYSRSLEDFQDKFTLTKLLEKFELASDGTLEVTLGVFNSPNRIGDTFLLDVEAIDKFMMSRIGRDIGEMQFPRVSSIGDGIEQIKRITTVDSSQSAGLLVDYYLRIGAEKDGKVPVMVVGIVDPSPALSAKLNERIRPSFGIRSITRPRMQEVGKPKVNDIEALVAFDVMKENPRLVSPATGQAR